ncbi:MAG: cupin domain-containing protein [Pseudomonadota bacterium]|nr:MAG: cupin domain-containing protein [Pseudomonadota bacterium]
MGTRACIGMATWFALFPVVTPVSGADFVGPVGQERNIEARSIEKILRENPLAPGENVKPIPLHRSAHTAHLLVQVRGREPAHYHADSDITVLMVRGHGSIHVGEQKLPAKSGDTLFVARGVVHYFVNEGKEPAVALVIYSPPPGPNDRVLVEPKSR